MKPMHPKGLHFISAKFLREKVREFISGNSIVIRPKVFKLKFEYLVKIKSMYIPLEAISDGKEKLAKLSETAFQELCADVYDEVVFRYS